VGFPIMAQDAVQYLQGQIEPPAVFLHPVQELHPLEVVQKCPDTVGLTDGRKNPLPVMPEGGMPDVVAQGDGLDEVFIQPQILADGPADLGKQLHVQHPVADMLMIDEVKNLGLVDVPGVGPGMENAVRVHREVLAMALGDALLVTPPHRLGAAGGIRRELALLLPVQSIPQFRQFDHPSPHLSNFVSYHRGAGLSRGCFRPQGWTSL